MLLVIMHKNNDYLYSLLPLMKEAKVPDVAIVGQKRIGSLLEGDSSNILGLRKSSLSEEYNKALIALVDDDKKVKEVMNQIENDTSLKYRNFSDKALICTLPYVQVKHLERGSFYAQKKEETIKMKIYEYLKEENILLDVKAQTKEKTIQELAKLLREEKDIINFDGFVSAVFAREELNTTGIGEEIAIPHARTNTVEDVVIALGISQKGINFDSTDGKPAKLIFLIGTPEKKKISAYLKLLAHLSRLLKKEDFRKSLLTASSAKQILDEFKKIES